MSAVFTRQLQAEKQKGRRRYLMLIPLGFLLFQFLWTIWQLRHADPEELAVGYLLLFHHLPMINAILLPMMTAVIASRLCDMEIKGDTLKLLYTMQNQTSFFNCKYLTGLKYLAEFTLVQGLLILGLGRSYHFAEPLKRPMLIEYLAVTFAVSAVLLAIQQTLSLLSASQILPLAAGLAGCFLGLFSLFFPVPIARLFIWGYYAAYPVAAIDWERDTRIIHYYEVPFQMTGFLIFLAAAVIIYLLCRTITIRKEV